MAEFVQTSGVPSPVTKDTFSTKADEVVAQILAPVKRRTQAQDALMLEYHDSACIRRDAVFLMRGTTHVVIRVAKGGPTQRFLGLDRVAPNDGQEAKVLGWTVRVELELESARYSRNVRTSKAA